MLKTNNGLGRDEVVKMLNTLVKEYKNNKFLNSLIKYQSTRGYLTKSQQIHLKSMYDEYRKR